MYINYYKRIFSAYFLNKNTGNLRFWHTEPRVNIDDKIANLNKYYLDYSAKTEYPGPFDANGVPMLNYFGTIGVQYNPDAIAQYALGVYEKNLEIKDEKLKKVFLNQAEWYVNNIQMREEGIGVFVYDFDFEYFKTLKKPWYTSLGQGHGISVLLRAYLLTNDSKYLETANTAFKSFEFSTKTNGGVRFTDENGDIWLEEAVVEPATHILNGFIWALWGIYDYWLITKETNALNLFNSCVDTIEKNLHRYDTGFWSRYDLAPTKIPCLASFYYHSLHIAQLKVMYLLTNRETFKNYAEKWERYKNKKFNRKLAFIIKAIFKLLYY
ncbi:MAG: D-glucuronyl C5-epimerase family protein [Parcubacteria group bacterium]